MPLAFVSRPYGWMRARLFRKYVLIISLLLVGALLFSGGLDIYFTYKDRLKTISDLERSEARLVASSIDFFIGYIHGQLEQATQVEYEDNESGIAAREKGYLALVNQEPAITRIGYWDSTGLERFVMAQFGRENFAANSPLAIEHIFVGAKSVGTFYGPIYLDGDSIQHMTIGIAEPGTGQGVLVAEVDLSTVQLIIMLWNLDDSRWSYVVDSNGINIAHPTVDYFTQPTNVSHLPQVQSAINDATDFNRKADSERAVTIEKSLDGQSVLATSFPVGDLGWNVLVEHPRSEALASLTAPIVRSVILLLAGLVLAVLTSLILARRMVSPILKLRDAADTFGLGSTDEMVHLKTGDELESLGEAFNRMSAQVRESYATLEERVERRTSELAQTNADLKRAEDESRLANQRLNEMNRTLEQRVTLRTSELMQANHRLIEAHEQMMRTEKLAAIGELSAGVAHDLRNPLGAIKNATYYLKKKLLDTGIAKENPRIPEFLSIIDDEVGHSDKIIGDLMDFARISTPTFSRVDLTTLLQDCLETLYLKEGVDINFSANHQEEPLRVKADAQQLQRVFQNLILNAQDAMPDGGVISVSASETEDFAEVSVSDTGMGIEPEFINKIFDPLFTTKMKGTGLGLAVCQQIVSKHGGTIEVESRPGEGTAFRVRLPLAASESPAREVQHASP